MGYIVFLSMFLPLPYVVEQQFDTTVLAMKMGATVPFLYEATARFHPSQESFMGKMEETLDDALRYTKSSKSTSRRASRTGKTDEARVDDFLDRVERYLASDGY